NAPLPAPVRVWFMGCRVGAYCLLLYARTASGQKITSRAADQASENTSELPVGVPISSVRLASITWVTGLTFAQARSQPGSVSVGAARLVPSCRGRNAMKLKASTT